MLTNRRATWVTVVGVEAALFASALAVAGCYQQAPVYEAQSYQEPQTYEAQAGQPATVAPTAEAEVQPAEIASPFGNVEASATVSAPPPIASVPVEPAPPAQAPAVAPAVASAPVVTPAPAPAPAAAAAPQPVASSQADVVAIPITARPEFFALLERSQSLMNAGQYPQALRVLNAARRFSQHPAVLYNMAICLEHIGAFQRAVAVYRRVTPDPVLGPRATERINVIVGSQMIRVR